MCSASLVDAAHCIVSLYVLVTHPAMFGGCLYSSSFRSVVVAIRAVATIVVTLLCVYGLSVVIFQQGYFNFLRLPGLRGTTALCWLPPVLGFSVICGLALDYDVFLVQGPDTMLPTACGHLRHHDRPIIMTVRPS